MRCIIIVHIGLYPLIIVTIFERRSVSADGVMLYLASSHHQSHRLHKEHAFIYTISRKKEREKEQENESYERNIEITGRIIIREERYMDVVTIS